MSRSVPADQVGMGRRRETRQRRMIERALGEHREFVSAQELHAQLRAAGQRVGLTTVYLHLRALTADGTVTARWSQDGEALYRRCEMAPGHYHLICRACPRTIDIAPGELDDWVRDVGSRNGFTDLQPTVEITGICGQCPPQAAATRGHPPFAAAFND